jgi:hypothetical protein
MLESGFNSYGHKRKIHLHHQPRTTKGRGLVHYYSLATSFFEDGKNQKRIIWTVGELTDEQAEAWRVILRGMNGQIAVENLVDIESVVVQGDQSYLDVLTLNELWLKLGLHKLFDQSFDHGKKMSTEQVARVLTINRLLSPQAKVKTVEWFQTTLLPTILGVDPTAYERNKVFRELDGIHRAKPAIEKAFLKFSKAECKDFSAYYFDGSTSWFEGTHCALAEGDIEKTRGYFPKVLGLMLITDSKGYPVAWEVVNGNRHDTTEFKNFVDRIKLEYKIDNLTYCFDRGVASIANFSLETERQEEFVSAIRDNQIRKILDLNPFEKTRQKIVTHVEEVRNGSAPKAPPRRVAGIDQFLSFDDNRFFRDLGVKGDHRYIASFSHDLFIKESEERSRRLDRSLSDISELNIELALAKGDRDYNATERELLEILSKHGFREFIEYTLVPLTTSNKAQSFRIECGIKIEKIEESALTDGILVYITNHIERKTGTDDFIQSGREIVAHYKGKWVVENAFREMKSFLELRPFFVWTDDHVKAHYDIAIMACFINNYICKRLEDIDVSIRGFYSQLKKAAPVRFLAPGQGAPTVCKLAPIPEPIKEFVKKLGIPNAVSPSVHRSHRVFP